MGFLMLKMAASRPATHFTCRFLKGRNLLNPWKRNWSTTAVNWQRINFKRLLRLSTGVPCYPKFTRTYANSYVEPKALSVEKAVQIVKEQFSSSLPEPMLYVGLGQYYNDLNRERVVVLQTCSEFCGIQHSILLDASIESSNVDELMKRIEGICDNFSHGEINCVANSKWNHGFTVQPDFRIFTEQSWHCDLNADRLRVLTNQSFEELPLENIQSLNVHLSEEPWNEQGIDLHLTDDSYFGLLQFEIINNNRDLAMLMVDTEWTVKTAAILCLKIRKLGFKVQLNLPTELTINGNPWVQDRHNSWTRLITSL